MCASAGSQAGWSGHTGSRLRHTGQPAGAACRHPAGSCRGRHPGHSGSHRAAGAFWTMLQPLLWPPVNSAVLFAGASAASCGRALHGGRAVRAKHQPAGLRENPRRKSLNAAGSRTDCRSARHRLWHRQRQRAGRAGGLSEGGQLFSRCAPDIRQGHGLWCQHCLFCSDAEQTVQCRRRVYGRQGLHQATA